MAPMPDRENNLIENETTITTTSGRRMGIEVITVNRPLPWPDEEEAKPPVRGGKPKSPKDRRKAKLARSSRRRNRR